MPADPPDGSFFDRILVPQRTRTPAVAIARRVALAVGLIFFVAGVVRLTRDGYVDAAGGEIGFLDALYYASVTVTTTGYGDITAIGERARLATLLFITPARILFLILVVSTTVEVLTEQSRQRLAARRWRNRVNDHYLILGFGSTGQAALRDLLSRGVAAEEVVVVDIESKVLESARRYGVTAVLGDASENSVLESAAIDRARSVIITPGRDDTAVLVTLTTRELNPTVHIVAGGNEQENLHLLRQGGADQVVDATAAVGRMLGLGTVAPGASIILEDLLDGSDGLELVDIAGNTPLGEDETLVAVIRDGKRMRPEMVDLDRLSSRDRLVVMREA